MTLDEFEKDLIERSDDAAIRDFCQARYLHGNPVVFVDKESEYFEFKKRICAELDVSQHDIFITGSAKFGFSPHKKTNFSFNSDIDVAIVSTKLVSSVDDMIHRLEYQLRAAELSMTTYQSRMYFDFLKYRAIGWMRPDKLPKFSDLKSFNKTWFQFFDSISNGKSEVGNFRVNAGAFVSMSHLEDYCVESAKKVRQKLLVQGESNIDE